MSFYNGSRWDEDATEMSPAINRMANDLAKKFKAKGKTKVEEKDIADRFEESDRIQARLGFRLNRSPYKRRR